METDTKTNYETTKEWVENNRERWNEYQRNYTTMRYKKDEKWREERINSKNKSMTKKRETDPDFYKNYSKTYYENNKNEILFKIKVQRYLKRLYNTINDFEDDDMWFFHTLKFCKNDDVIQSVMNQIDDYMQKKEDKEKP